MKAGEDSLRRSLQGLLGGVIVQGGADYTARYGDGCPPGREPLIWVSPTTEAQVRELLLWASREGVPVYPRGGGTRWRSAFRPFREGVGVDLTGLDRVIDLDPKNLSVVAEAGLTYASLQSALAPHRLFFPPDPECPETSTLGGQVATDAAGPRRYAYGSVRSYLLGCSVRFPNGLGGQFGGNQVKNVSGYNLTRFLSGTWGSLGVITEVILKVRPSPHRRLVLVATGRLTELLELANEIRLELYGVAAIEVLSGPPAIAFARDLATASGHPGPTLSASGERPALLMIGMEGMDEEVSASASCLEVIAGRHEPQWLDGSLSSDDLWTIHRRTLSLGLSLGAQTWVATMLPSDLTAVLLRITAGDFGPVGIVASVGSGIARVLVGPDCAAAPLLEELGRSTRALGGHLSAHDAKDALPELEVRSVSGPLLGVWRRLKDVVDPGHVMCPAGRLGG